MVDICQWITNDSCCPGLDGETAAMLAIQKHNTSVKLWRFIGKHVDEAVLGGKPPAVQSVDSLLSWYGSQFQLVLHF